MHYLVTGGAGFIGSHLVDRLIADGHEVTVVDDLSTGKIGQINSKAEWKGVWGVEDPFYLDPETSIDSIFHLAAMARIQPSFRFPTFYHHSNVTGTLRMLELARERNCPLIFAGSSSCLDYHFLNPYTLTKHIGEEYCQLYQEVFGVRVAVLRFHNVYGPRQIEEGEYSTVIGVFERQYRNGEPLTITGDGKQQRDFTHVDDIVNGLVAAEEELSDTAHCDPEDFSEPISLGTGRAYSINEVAAMFGTEQNHIPFRPGEAMVTVADTQLAEEVLGWVAKRGLKEYVQGVVNQQKDKCNV
jgi:UDP-glucose 4-epimerase